MGHGPVLAFPFAFARSYAVAGAPFGVTARTTGVEVDDAELRVRFGPWRFTAPKDEVVGTVVTGPYSFLKTAGPPHLGWTDLGLTLATNGDQGLRVDLARRRPGIEPFGLLRHHEVTLTVADVEGLRAALSSGRL